MKRSRRLQLLFTCLLLTASAWGQLTNTHTTSPYCLKGGTYWGMITYYTNWTYTDAYGAHPFTGTSFLINGSPANCPAVTSGGFTTKSSDGLGYEVTTNGSNGSVKLPTVATGYVNPKYLIVGVTYAPPGPSSFVAYQNSITVGNTASISSSFSSSTTKSLKVTKALGIKGWVGGSVSASASTSDTQDSSSSTAVTVSKTTTGSYTTPGPSNAYAGINHDYDIIWLWLNPLVLLNTFKTTSTNAIQWNGYGYSTLDQPAMDIYPVLVGWLNGDIAMTPAQSGPLNRTWAAGQVWPAGQGPGLTATDFQTIVKADPYWQCSKTPSACPSMVDPVRFTLTFNQDFVYQQAAPGGQPGTQTYSSSYTNTTTQNQGAKFTTSQTFGYERTFSGSGFLANLSFDLVSSSTLTWIHEWRRELTSSSTSLATISVTGPPCVVSAGHCNPVYTKSTQFDLYQDVLYGTFYLNPVN